MRSVRRDLPGRSVVPSDGVSSDCVGWSGGGGRTGLGCPGPHGVSGDESHRPATQGEANMGFSLFSEVAYLITQLRA